jgi:uncharacterized protein involved in exopolysaccharide biosynthesis
MGAGPVHVGPVPPGEGHATGTRRVRNLLTGPFAPGTLGRRLLSMLRFLDCFYRDRRLLLAMIAIAVVLSVGVVVIQPRVYEATARAWVDASIQGDHPNPYITPADAGNQILGELLRTRAFCVKVGQRSTLLPPNPAGHRSTDRGAEDAVYQTLNAQTVLGTAGPNVVTVSFRNRDASLTASTTQAIIDVFKQEVLGGQAQRARATVGFYEQQVKTARDELSRADGRISDYLGTSLDSSGGLTASVTPDLSASALGSTTDVALMALQRDDDAARKRTDDLTLKLNQARLDLTMAQQSTPNGFRVIDAPMTPQRPVSRTKPLLAAGAGGLLAGVLISLLALTALTAVDRSLRYPSEVEPALGLQLVGAVPHVG